ncbi:hypothetical protein [Virgibacillus sp. YIM 98842]|uniref:hypothetical protein n=1 Tax=Virgibacillus sp. YIM 98842 TaxID=2663533 RepID=UPI0013D9D1DE|nr:hypothetical protein [Virgibacillus sp. YIM 98842]
MKWKIWKTGTVYLTEDPSGSESHYVFIGYVQNQKENGGVEMRFIVEKNLDEEVSILKKMLEIY